MTDRNRFPEDDRFADRPNRNSGLWTVIALLVVILVAGVFYGWSTVSGSSPTTAANGVSGQAASRSGSTTSGAPVGTPTSQTTGQAVSPSGSATTGSNAKR